MTVKYFITISLNMMKNFLYFDLMQKLNNCLTNDRALGDRYQSFQTAFTSAFTRLDEVMHTSRKSMLTPEIQRLDAQRIQEWRIIRSAAREQERMADQDVATAAGFVMSLINNHGDVQAMKVAERTGALTNLAQDLTVQYASQVATVGMTEFARQLAATNAEYIRVSDERLHEWSEYTDGEVLAARSAVDDALENLFIMTASGILTQGMPPFKHFVDYANEAIKVAKIAMGASGMKPEGGETEPTLPPTTEPETPPTTEPETPPTTEPETPPTTEPETPPTTEPENPGGGNTDKVTVTFHFENGGTETREYPKGTILRPGGTNYPANTPGYNWSILNVTLNSDTNAWEVSEGDSGLD